MISIAKLIQNISNCKDTNIKLGEWNDENSKFLQKTGIQLRKIELENNENICTDMGIDVNKYITTMDRDLQILNTSNISNNTHSNIHTNNIFNQATNSNTLEKVDSRSLIVYVENEIATLPEIIISMLSECKIDYSEWYIFGLKNPETFYKSYLYLYKKDFIIKNKNERKNEIATFKREHALHYEKFYKALNYGKYRFSKSDMMKNLTDTENYCKYDAIKYICDYNQSNIIILDIISMKYIDIAFTPNNLNSELHFQHSETDIMYSKWTIIIKYSNNTYLPLMNTSGNHNFDISFNNKNILEYISHNFERIKIEHFREIPNTNNATCRDEYGLIISDLNTDVSTQFYNDTVDKSLDECNINNPIEDMIEIEEQELTPIGQKQTNNSNINQREREIQKTQTEDTFTLLMNKIPMKINSETKTKKQNITNNNTIASNNPITHNHLTTGKPIEKDDFEELKPLNKYNLIDLQSFARFYKIDTQKEGKSGRKINKTKEEMYNEILAKQQNNKQK
jgi:hypothetical protein